MVKLQYCRSNGRSPDCKTMLEEAVVVLVVEVGANRDLGGVCLSQKHQSSLAPSYLIAAS